MSYYAVLIGVSKTGRTKVRLPAAVPAITAMQTFLLSAAVPLNNIEFLAEKGYKEVDDAFGRIAPRVTKHDTLLIMFAGHGVQGQGTDPDAWALTGMDVITDKVLADWMASVPGAARRIVISDCCYGLGIARPGPGVNAFPALCAVLRYELARLRQRLFFDFLGRARRFARALTARIRSVEPLTPMICLAAASAVDEVTNRDERLFLTLTLGTAAGRGAYSDLKQDFETVRTATSAFCIEPDPDSGLKQFVLGLPEAPAPAGAAAPAAKA